MPFKIQAVLFDKRYGWTAPDAKRWLKRNEYKPIKPVHKTTNFLRYRIHRPNATRYVMKKADGGVQFVIGQY